MNGAAASAVDGFGAVASLGELIALRALATAPARGAAARLSAPGEHATPRRARGVEFAEVRRYESGDDVRTVDWRQTARRGVLYTKLYQEERERPLRLLVDLGASMRFGTRVAFKSVVAARAAALLAWTAVAAGDRVGGVVLTGAAQDAVAPQRRRRGALDFLKRLAAASATAVADAPVPLAQALAALPRADGTVAVISDFATLDAASERLLGALGRRSELLLVHVYDVFEAAPPPGCYRLSDGKRDLTVDLRGEAARAAYGAAFAARRQALERLARRGAATLLALPTDGDLPALLARAHGARRGGQA